MTRKMMKLHMQKGTDEVNYGTESFKVPASGYVEVPLELAETLLKEGGAVQVLPGALPDGYVKVRHVSDPNASFNFEGVTYMADDDGVIDAPYTALSHIESHGFIVC